MIKINFKSAELTEKFKNWWSSSFRGNIPIYHPADLQRFAELIICSKDKQDELNLEILHNFLLKQIKDNKIKNDSDSISRTIELYEFCIDHLLPSI